ncbi:MAG: ATP-binding protein [Promethearchaeota archaeon]
MIDVSYFDLVSLIFASIFLILSFSIKARLFSKHVKIFIILMGIFHFILTLSNYLKWAKITDLFEEYEEFVEFLFITLAFLVFYQYYLDSFHLEIHNYNLKLIQEQKKSHTILMDLSDAVIVIDIDENIEFINRKAEEILKIKSTESIHRKIDEILIILREKDNQSRRIYTKDSYFSKILNNKFQSRYDRDYFIETPNVPDGPKIRVQFQGTPLFNEKNNPIGGLIVIQDITEQKRIEKILIETERFQSITLLARGLAHDFNNILTAIIGNVGLLKESNKISEEYQDFIKEIEYSTLRAKGITAQLATLAKNKKDIKKGRIDIPNLVMESINFSLRGTNIIPEYDFEEKCYIRGNENDLSRVFHNISINAMQAMPHGGTINIDIGNPTNEVLLAVLVENVKYIQISIQDHGVGIPKENMEMIFQPFYTTKAQGSGLGLAIVENIIRNHDGFISVKSTIGEGTTITIALPQQEVLEKAEESTHETREKFEGKILILEDDENVSRVLIKMLNFLGFEVDLTVKGNDTIHQYKEAMKKNIQYYAVILDFVIQGDAMNGVEVFQEIKKLNSDAFTIISSGSIVFSSINESVRMDEIHFLNKPYLISDLREILSKKNNPNLNPY